MVVLPKNLSCYEPVNRLLSSSDAGYAPQNSLIPILCCGRQKQNGTLKERDACSSPNRVPPRLSRILSTGTGRCQLLLQGPALCASCQYHVATAVSKAHSSCVCACVPFLPEQLILLQPSARIKQISLNFSRCSAW